jgi:chromosome segregation ATPase
MKDLPGSLDSNLARSMIAANYQKELSVSCVVANIDRGISNGNVSHFSLTPDIKKLSTNYFQAQDLLEKTTKRNLQLDGLYNSDSLCFVLSQTDKDFNTGDYIKQTPDLAESAAADSRQMETFKDKIAELKRQTKDTTRKRGENKKHAKELSKEIQDVKSRLNTLSNSSGNLSQNRKRGSNDREAGELINILCFVSQKLLTASRLRGQKRNWRADSIKKEGF